MTPQATSGGWPTNDGTLSASSPLPAKSEARVQDELDQTPLIVRLRHRERRVVLEHDLNRLDRAIEAQGDRLHLLRRRCNDLRPAEEVWRAWQAEHKPDLDRLLATLRLRISLAENLRRPLAEAEKPAPRRLSSSPSQTPASTSPSEAPTLDAAADIGRAGADPDHCRC